METNLCKPVQSDETRATCRVLDHAAPLPLHYSMDHYKVINNFD